MHGAVTIFASLHYVRAEIVAHGASVAENLKPIARGKRVNPTELEHAFRKLVVDEWNEYRRAITGAGYKTIWEKTR